MAGCRRVEKRVGDNKRMKNIAIVTARGGSKRIPNKNIRDFLGKPILSYSINAALESKLFAEVMVSTDSEKIASIAKEYGAAVPFLRSKKNADDFATSVDAVIEVLNKCEEIGKVFDYGCCIYPTAPFMKAGDLIQSYRLMLESDADCAVSVVKFDFPPQRGYKIKNGRLHLINPENYEIRSQDLEPIYHDAGQFYFFKPEGVKSEKKLTLRNNVPYIVDSLRVQDIDNEEDWKLAELKYRILYEK